MTFFPKESAYVLAKTDFFFDGSVLWSDQYIDKKPSCQPALVDAQNTRVNSPVGYYSKWLK